MDFLHDLNDSQQQAVLQTDGPSLVIAGAGSGKTRVLTYKIAYLLDQGVPAQNILALTFTNKAAREMRERINALVGEHTAHYLWMGTFHSICARILRQEAEVLGYSHDYTIYDTTDSKSLLKQIIREMDLDDKVYKVSNVLARISMAKNALLSPADYASNKNLTQADSLNRMYRLSDIFFTYNQRLRQANAMDFDDLLFNMNLLLTQHETIRNKWQKVFKYVLVDEYQDTNHSQYRIVTMLAAPENNICVVGDDAQSIYSFRGADIGNILHFQDQYEQSKLYKLERNYRSTQNIVGAANSLIKKNIGQIPKEVYSEKEKGEPLLLTTHNTDRDEAAFIAKTIKSDNTSYNDFAVLYRTNAQSRVIEDELRKLNIPYRIYGSVSFYQRKEIKDALAYFRLIVNLQDDEALLRIVNYPARGIGETTMRRVLDAAHNSNVPAFKVVQNAHSYNTGISTATASRLASFAQLISSFREKMTELNAYEFAKYVLSASSVLVSALQDKTPEGQDRYENLQELLNSIHEFVEERGLEGETFTPISDFLAEVSLLTDQDENLKDNTPRVSLMTVHSAKGLEFPVVFIAGMEEKLFPSAFSESPREIEEERRLFYVAITRAERQCLITCARQRFRNGQIMFSNESRFLHDIDPRFIERQETQPTRKAWKYDFDDFQSNRFSSFNSISKPANQQQNGEKTDIQSPFAVGTRVCHSVFGNGTVKRAYAENGNDKVEVFFDRAGLKILLLKFAKLQKI